MKRNQIGNALLMLCGLGVVYVAVRTAQLIHYGVGFDLPGIIRMERVWIILWLASLVCGLWLRAQRPARASGR